MYQRTLAKIIKDIDNTFPVLILTGPRQVGKTTLLQSCAGSTRHYVTLDDLELRDLAINDPALFMQAHKPPLIIDEIQYAPNLLSYIKISVDKEKKTGMYWITGSQKFHLMKGISESLAGRAAVLDLLGFSQAEANNKAESNAPFVPTEEWITQARHNATPKQLMDVYHDIWRGSYPKLLQDPNISRDIFYKSYIQTYIQRDVKDILKISNDAAFNRFLRVIAARTGQMLNYSDLARDTDVDHKTMKSWLFVLEASGLIYLLAPYYNNINKRLVKTPKLYFLDTGLCSYLTQWPSPESLEAGAMSGAILETYIFTEILKSYWHHGKNAYFYYYRDQDQKEIDLILESGDTLYPVEFKKTAMPTLNAVKSFHALEKLGKKVGPGAVICLRESELPLSQNIMSIPIGYL
jgi:predicted AAA+ superfamily ATPase